jgi:general secretion pathway protein G
MYEKRERRHGFTMIELIFAIVVIGILAVVALPKLAATRDDALMVRKAHAIMTSASEIAAYTVAGGKSESNLSIMSNTLAVMI